MASIITPNFDQNQLLNACMDFKFIINQGADELFYKNLCVEQITIFSRMDRVGKSMLELAQSAIDLDIVSKILIIGCTIWTSTSSAEH